MKLIVYFHYGFVFVSSKYDLSLNKVCFRLIFKYENAFLHAQIMFLLPLRLIRLTMAQLYTMCHRWIRATTIHTISIFYFIANV